MPPSLFIIIIIIIFLFEYLKYIDSIYINLYYLYYHKFALAIAPLFSRISGARYSGVPQNVLVPSKKEKMH